MPRHHPFVDIAPNVNKKLGHPVVLLEIGLLHYGILQDAQYFSDSEHQMVSGSWYRGLGGQGDMHRRMRNRTLTGLESMRMDHLAPRPGSAQGRPITPSFSNDKDPGQTFIDFNPAGVLVIS